MSVNLRVELLVNGSPCDLPADFDNMFGIDYTLEDPGELGAILSHDAKDVDLPATKNNNLIFGSLWNLSSIDMTANKDRENFFDFILVAGGTTIMKGKLLLKSATSTTLPGHYSVSLLSGNAEWMIDGEQVTLFDCVNPQDQNYTEEAISNTWGYFDGRDEDNDFIFTPVRYRQPWGTNNSLTTKFPPDANYVGRKMTMFDLRPSISIYWTLYRWFKMLGFTIESQFMDTDYFRRLVMLWTWGDFFDISGDLIKQIGFKITGRKAPYPSPSITDANWYGAADPTISDYTLYDCEDGRVDTGVHVPAGQSSITGGFYRFIRPFVTTAISGGGDIYRNWYIDVDNAPYGYNNFGESILGFISDTGSAWCGAVHYKFDPPYGIFSKLSAATSTVTLEFTASLICKTAGRILAGTGAGDPAHLNVYIVVDQLAGGFGTPVRTSYLIPDLSIDPRGTSFEASSPKGSITTPTVFTFSHPHVQKGDVLYLRVMVEVVNMQDWHFQLANSVWLNDGTHTKTFLDWTYQYSSMQLKGISVDPGGIYNLKWYDQLKNYFMRDMLKGLCDMFNLVVQTDNINRVVKIEPFLGGQTLTGTDVAVGYFRKDWVLDWTSKLDRSQPVSVVNYHDTPRQHDFSMKQDSGDGGANIWAARFVGVYTHNNMFNRVNTTNMRNGVLSGVPGASRYLFPTKMGSGFVERTNGFFSALMHYKETLWHELTTYGRGVQLPVVFPENVSGGSNGSVSQIFVPKIAYVKPRTDAPDITGAMLYIGDPDASLRDGGSGPDVYGNGIPTYDDTTGSSFYVPLTFQVNYGTNGVYDPVLTYSDQVCLDDLDAPILTPGLFRKFHLSRYAILQSGAVVEMYMHLTMSDVCNPFHREFIFIEGQPYLLIRIDNFNPVGGKPVKCTFLKYTPITEDHVSRCFPSESSVTASPTVLDQWDVRYAPSLILHTDVEV